MKITILTPTYSFYSGPDRVVHRQAQDFLKSGHDVLIVTLGGDITPPKGAKLVKLGMPKNPTLQRIYRFLMFMDARTISKAAALVKGSDKIICHMYPMTLIARRAQKKYKIHYNYYNMGVAYPRLFRSFFERTAMKIFLKLTIWTVKGADSATSISEFLRQELLDETGVDGNVEHCKIDKRFKKGLSGDSIKKKYGLKGPVCLYVGRISPHKGIHLLIKSFKIIKEKYPTAALIIAGKPTFDSYFNELKRLANRDKSIIFTGFVDDEDVPLMYAACDVYTTATLWEGFDLPAAEAQACGKPVVGYDIGAHPEVIKTGKIVKEEDVEAFADAVIDIIRQGKKKSR
jgi:glycosyltransferase involved in cell wall biosynthesis